MRNVYIAAFIGLVIITSSIVYATKTKVPQIFVENNQPVVEVPQIVNAPLTGTEWVWLHTELSNGDLTATEAREQYVLKLNEDKSVTSTTDCNSLSGSYVQDGEVISFTPFAMTKKACAGSIDTTYAEQLGLATSHQIIENRMYINLNRDAGRMVFEKK